MCHWEHIQAHLILIIDCNYVYHGGVVTTDTNQTYQLSPKKKKMPSIVLAESFVSIINANRSEYMRNI